MLSVPWLSACCFLTNLWYLTLTTPTLSRYGIIGIIGSSDSLLSLDPCFGQSSCLQEAPGGPSLPHTTPQVHACVTSFRSLVTFPRTLQLYMFSLRFDPCFGQSSCACYPTGLSRPRIPRSLGVTRIFSTGYFSLLRGNPPQPGPCCTMAPHKVPIAEN